MATSNHNDHIHSQLNQCVWTVDKIGDRDCAIARSMDLGSLPDLAGRELGERYKRKQLTFDEPLAGLLMLRSPDSC